MMALLLLLTAWTGTATPQSEVRIGAGLPSSGGNGFYVGNREPLAPSPLIKLPLGSVRAQGWLKTQLDLMTEGFTGRLPEISQFCKFEGNAWTNPGGSGQFGWEEVPYWLKGFVDLGYLTMNARVQSESRRWIEAVLSTQAPSGYFGSRANLEDAAAGTRVMDLWPNMVMLYPLRTYYEVTGDKRILPFMTRYFQWQKSLPLEKMYPGSWQKWRAGDNLDSIYWLYNRTGEAWLLDLARVNHERTADWVGDIPTWHGVNLAQCFREPAMYFQQTRDERYLSSTYRVLETVKELYGQFPGGMYAADENARPGFSGPRQGAETCAIVELMHSYEILLRVTGELRWADRVEDLAFNSLPASMTPDLKGLHYLTAPNMIQLDRQDKSPMFDNDGDMLSYNPYQYRCCQHNAAFGWPYFTENLWLATRGNGLAAAMYAPSIVTATVGDGKSMRIESRTPYPFYGKVELAFDTPQTVKFPLALRIPGWCATPAIGLNGRDLHVPKNHGGWVTIDRSWSRGDKVSIELPMEIRVRTWEKNRRSISVDRGPLTYSLKIGERWQEYRNDPNWPAYEVYPTTSWNYGLSSDSFEVVRPAPPIAAQPFSPEGAPIFLKAKGRKIPQWRQEPGGLVGEIQLGPVISEEPEENIELIPMGCARLRITAFPRIGTGPDARRWDDNPPMPLASRAWHYYPPSAMNDGFLPKSSSDLSQPWFVWWDTYGSREWAEYRFSAPRKISWTELYWADEGTLRNSGRVPHDVRLQAPTDGRVHLPASWKLVYWTGSEWKPVTTSGSYGIVPDKFNRVSFGEVVTTALRIEAQLQPRSTAGILEWRVGP
jgi:hypothetical protein